MTRTSAPAGTSDRPKIWIVDDDPEVLKLTRLTLSHMLDAEYTTISAPEDAARRIRSEPFDVLLCDFKMPVFDGLTLLRMAQRYNPDALRILVTGEMDAEQLAPVMDEKILWRVVFKPWKAETLQTTVREGLLYLKARARQKKIQSNLAAAAQKGKPGAGTTPAVSGKPKVMFVGRPEGKVKTPPPAHPRPSHVRLPRPPTPNPSARRVRLLSRGAVTDTGWLGKRYRIDRKIKEGGSGEVYQAFDVLLDMPVAVKVLAADFANHADVLASLKREARIALQLSHSHIVRLHTMDIFHNRHCLIMEYIDGINLRQWIQNRGPMNAEQVSQIAGVCADALSYAHRHGVYHRDLKPDNIMIRRDGVIKLIDFGIAVSARLPGAASNVVEGTPWYMSPEEIRGEPADGRTDVYSLGVTLHEMLTGMLPFSAQPGDTDPLRIRPAVLSPALSPAVSDALAKALATKRDQRWEDVTSFATALQQALAGNG